MDRTDRMRIDKMDVTDPRIQQIRRNIEYEHHMEHDSYGDRDIYNGLYQVICDVALGDTESYSIGGAVYPAWMVKERFMRLKGSHLEYVRERISNNPGDVRNMRKYMMTALFNAPSTMDTYYAQLVNHDMYGS